MMNLLNSYENETNKKKAEIYEGQTNHGKNYYSAIGIHSDGTYGNNLYIGYSLEEAIEQALWYIY